MAQLRKHSPDMLGEISSNHHWHQPLNPYMIGVTLEPGDFSRYKIDSLTYIRIITIREHHDVFEPLECLLLLGTIKAVVGFWLEPIFRQRSGGCMCKLFLSHSFSTSNLALTLSFDLPGMFRTVRKRDSRDGKSCSRYHHMVSYPCPMLTITTTLTL